MPFEIRPIEDKYYPLEEAIQKAAEQNVRRDNRLGIIGTDQITDLSEVDREKYISEASRVMVEFGVNYVPNSPEHERIRVAQELHLPMDEAVRKVAETLCTYWFDQGTLPSADFASYNEQAQSAQLSKAQTLLAAGHWKHYLQNYSKAIIYVKAENRNG